MMRIDIDDREKELIPKFDYLENQRKYEFNIKRLTTADIAIFAQQCLKILIERKTWDDLAASIKDGRLEKQLQNMKEVKQKTQATLILMIEGSPKKEHNGIKVKNLISKLTSLVITDVIHVQYSFNIEDTAVQILRFVDLIPIDVSDVIAAAPDVLTEVKEKGDEEILKDMFCSIKNISTITARMLIKSRWSIMDLYESESVILTTLVYPSGNTIPLAKAKKITETMGTKQAWIKILSAINGITNKTAEMILTMYPDPYTWNVENLSNIKKSETRKVGQQISNNIIKYLNLRLP